MISVCRGLCSVQLKPFAKIQTNGENIFFLVAVGKLHNLSLVFNNDVVVQCVWSLHLLAMCPFEMAILSVRQTLIKTFRQTTSITLQSGALLS